MDFINKYLFAPVSFSAPNGINFISKDISFSGPAIIAIPFAITLLGCFFWSLVWVYGDAKKRNKNPIFAIVFLLVAGWPISLWCWHYLRPEIKEGSREDSV